MAHALPRDELLPLSCSGKDTWGPFSLTLIDALDTYVGATPSLLWTENKSGRDQKGICYLTWKNNQSDRDQKIQVDTSSCRLSARRVHHCSASSTRLSVTGSSGDSSFSVYFTVYFSFLSHPLGMKLAFFLCLYLCMTASKKMRMLHRAQRANEKENDPVSVCARAREGICVCFHSSVFFP